MHHNIELQAPLAASKTRKEPGDGTVTAHLEPQVQAVPHLHASLPQAQASTLPVEAQEQEPGGHAQEPPSTQPHCASSSAAGTEAGRQITRVLQRIARIAQQVAERATKPPNTRAKSREPQQRGRFQPRNTRHSNTYVADPRHTRIQHHTRTHRPPARKGIGLPKGTCQPWRRTAGGTMRE